MRFDKTPWKEPFFRRDHANDDKMEHTKGEENTPSVAGDPPIHGSSFSSAGYSPNMKSWIASTVDQLPHPSMKPKAVDLAFTPYPLPKYDPSLGFGPVVLKNIPDIHKAQQRFSTTPSTPSSSPPQQTTGAATFKDADVEEDLGVARQAPEVEEPPLPMPERSGWVTESPATPLPSIASRSPRTSATKRPIAFADWRADGRDERETLSLRQSGIVDPDSGETATTASQAPPEAEDADAESAALTPSSAWETDAAPLAPPSYFVEGDERLRILDRLVCRRSLKDLLHQFTSRPQREARTATVLDLASTLSLRRTEEFTSLFYELTSLFATSSGNTQAGGGLGVGLQFLVAKVVKFGRPYYVTDELMKAYLVLLASATEYFTQVAPHHLFPSYFSFSTASSSPLSASVVMFSPDMVSAEGSTSASLCIQLLDDRLCVLFYVSYDSSDAIVPQCHFFQLRTAKSGVQEYSKYSACLPINETSPGITAGTKGVLWRCRAGGRSAVDATHLSRFITSAEQPQEPPSGGEKKVFLFFLLFFLFFLLLVVFFFS